MAHLLEPWLLPPGAQPVPWPRAKAPECSLSGQPPRAKVGAEQFLLQAGVAYPWPPVPACQKTVEHRNMVSLWAVDDLSLLPTSKYSSSSSDGSDTDAPEADALLAEAVEVSINGVESLMTKSDSDSNHSGRATRVDQSMESIASEGFTTLMVRNLPHNLSQSDLLRELDRSGFQDLYDFVYMPSIFHSGRGKGYAFINFVCPTVACFFMSAWHKSHRFAVAKNTKTLDISVACVQGRDANVLKWDESKRRRVLNPNYRPVIKGKVGLGGHVAYNPTGPAAPPVAPAMQAVDPAAPVGVVWEQPHWFQAWS